MPVFFITFWLVLLCAWTEMMKSIIKYYLLAHTRDKTWENWIRRIVCYFDNESKISHQDLWQHNIPNTKHQLYNCVLLLIPVFKSIGNFGSLEHHRKPEHFYHSGHGTVAYGSSERAIVVHRHYRYNNSRIRKFVYRTVPVLTRTGDFHRYNGL